MNDDRLETLVFEWLQNPAYSFSESFSPHRFKLTKLQIYNFLIRYGKYPVST